MKSRAVRLTLFWIFVAAIGAAAYVFWTNESRVRKEADDARAFDREAVAATIQVHELRSAQQGYVAAGQGDDFWIAKVSSALAVLREELTALQAQTTSLSGQSSLQTAMQSLQAFERMDRRAREYARSGQKLLASDLIYADGLEAAAAAAASIEAARQFERSAHERTTSQARLRQVGAAGGIAALGLLLIAMMVPGKKTAEPEQTTSVAPLDTRAAAADIDIGAALDAGWDAKDRTPASTRTTFDLAPVASLCTDLARVVDTQSLPALLARASTALDASGIVVWIADPDGHELMPVLTHGYAATVVTRLGTLLRDAENATAAAFRTGLLQTVKGDAMSDGAIAAPLVTPGGCVGVMAAEVRHQGEQDETKRAAAAIVAAQLATLVGPPSTSRQQAAGSRQ